MESININMELCEEFVKYFCFPSECYLVSKDAEQRIGRILLELETGFSSQMLIPKYAEASSKLEPKKQQSKKRTPDLPSVPTHQSKLSKKAPVFNQAKVESSVLSSSIPQPNVESFISINQNMTTGEKTFQCTFCGLSTGFKNSIKRHVMTTHIPSATVYECQTCDFKAKEKSNLKKHYMSKHKMPEAAAKGMLQG